jgi:septin 6/8/11
LQANGVHIYQFPTDDETVAEQNGSMNSHIPFAVVGSTEFVKLGSKMMRARQYPWVSLFQFINKVVNQEKKW